MQRRRLCPSLMLLAFTVAAAASAWPARAQTAPRVGEVVRMVPDVFLERATQRHPAQVQSPVHLQDTVVTERFARARLRLDDGSVLNVGAESSLQITTHDPVAQRSELDLAFGRIRARVVRRARPGTGFEVRTPTAVAGVAGTHFWVGLITGYTEVLCLDGQVLVRNADPSVAGEVLLRAGEFTQVFRGQAPTSAQRATPEQIRQALEQTDIAAGPFDWTRAELSWPPAGCGEGVQLTLRAWHKQSQAGQAGEVPMDADLVSGTLLLGASLVDVEAGQAVLPSAPGELPASGRFLPRGSTQEIPVKVWPPKTLVAGDGWRAPRAAFAGSAFYALGPMGTGGQPQFSFAGTPANLLWSGPCGAGFLAPPLPGGEYDVTLSINARPAASGKMNLVSVTYRVPVPPTVKRGQTSNFGVDLTGMQNLAPHAQGRPVLVARLVNTTPQFLGNLQSKTKGATVSGQTIHFAVGARNISPLGTARLDGSGKGLQTGAYVLTVDLQLDSALEEPRTPMTPIAGQSP